MLTISPKLFLKPRVSNRTPLYLLGSKIERLFLLAGVVDGGRDKLNQFVPISQVVCLLLVIAPGRFWELEPIADSSLASGRGSLRIVALLAILLLSTSRSTTEREVDPGKNGLTRTCLTEPEVRLTGNGLGDSLLVDANPSGPT